MRHVPHIPQMQQRTPCLEAISEACLICEHTSDTASSHGVLLSSETWGTIFRLLYRAIDHIGTMAMRSDSVFHPDHCLGKRL